MDLRCWIFQAGFDMLRKRYEIGIPFHFRFLEPARFCVLIVLGVRITFGVTGWGELSIHFCAIGTGRWRMDWRFFFWFSLLRNASYIHSCMLLEDRDTAPQNRQRWTVWWFRVSWGSFSSNYKINNLKMMICSPDWFQIFFVTKKWFCVESSKSPYDCEPF